MKTTKRLSQLPVLNDEASKLERNGMEHSKAWESLQQKWEEEEKVYVVKSQSGKFSKCSLCDDEIPDVVYTVVNNKTKKSLEVPHSVLHFIDEHPSSYSEEPVHKGMLPRKAVYDALGKRRWFW